MNECNLRNEQPLSSNKSYGSISQHGSNEATNNHFLIQNPNSVMLSADKNNPATSEDIENMSSSLGLLESHTSTALPDVVVHQDIENVASNQVNL